MPKFVTVKVLTNQNRDKNPWTRCRYISRGSEIILSNSDISKGHKLVILKKVSHWRWKKVSVSLLSKMLTIQFRHSDKSKEDISVKRAWKNWLQCSDLQRLCLISHSQCFLKISYFQPSFFELSLLDFFSSSSSVLYFLSFSCCWRKRRKTKVKLKGLISKGFVDHAPISTIRTGHC